jgi:hypothetical protein
VTSIRKASPSLAKFRRPVQMHKSGLPADHTVEKSQLCTDLGWLWGGLLAGPEGSVEQTSFTKRSSLRFSRLTLAKICMPRTRWTGLGGLRSRVPHLWDFQYLPTATVNSNNQSLFPCDAGLTLSGLSLLLDAAILAISGSSWLAGLHKGHMR